MVNFIFINNDIDSDKIDKTVNCVLVSIVYDHKAGGRQYVVEKNAQVLRVGQKKFHFRIFNILLRHLFKISSMNWQDLFKTFQSFSCKAPQETICHVTHLYMNKNKSSEGYI